MYLPTPLLTISILTYNRASTRETIQALLPQLTPEVRIQIIDNASEVPVTGVIQNNAALLQAENRTGV